MEAEGGRQEEEESGEEKGGDACLDPCCEANGGPAAIEACADEYKVFAATSLETWTAPIVEVPSN